MAIRIWSRHTPLQGLENEEVKKILDNVASMITGGLNGFHINIRRFNELRRRYGLGDKKF